MTEFQKTKFIFIVLIFCGIFGSAESSLAAEPATYYVDDNDCSDDYAGTSSDQPWCMFSEAMTKLQAGDTLIIKDGTYDQSLNVTVSGSQTSPITIKAENDGQAIVDGQGTVRPLFINVKSYINIEGIIFKNSSVNVVYIEASSYINLKRVSAYNSNMNDNTMIFHVSSSNHILLEDCVAAGTGRKPYNIFESRYVTLRRCWGRNETWTGPGGDGNSISLYGTDDSIVENCVFTVASGTDGNIAGVSIFAHQGYNDSADRNKIYGTLVSGVSQFAFQASSNEARIEGNEFLNSVSIDNKYAFRNNGDASGSFQKLTVINTGTTSTGLGFSVDEDTTFTKTNGFQINTVVKNSSFVNRTVKNIGLITGSGDNIGTFSHTYNKLYNWSTNYYGTSAGAGESELISDPYAASYATYGNGAYLMVPSALKGQGENGADIGAEVLYRYQDGNLTNERLWPWPMEDRIKVETSGLYGCPAIGCSVTYESDGGIWKTLNGVYDNDTTPPSAPSGLSVQ